MILFRLNKLNLKKFKRVRHYDKKILKPFLLREKIFSKDDKLLSDFKKINESNIDKLAKDFNYVLPSSASMAQLNMGRNLSIGNFLASGLVNDF